METCVIVRRNGRCTAEELQWAAQASRVVERGDGK
jgi:hypothetical protein